MEEDVEVILNQKDVNKVKKSAKNAKIVEETKDGECVCMRLRFKNVEDVAKFYEECASLTDHRMSDPPEDYPTSSSEKS